MQLVTNRHSGKMNRSELFIGQIVSHAMPGAKLYREPYIVVSDNGETTIPDFFLTHGHTSLQVILEITTCSFCDTRVWNDNLQVGLSFDSKPTNKPKQRRLLQEFHDMHSNYLPIFLYAENLSSPGCVVASIGVITGLLSGEIGLDRGVSKCHEIAKQGKQIDPRKHNWNKLLNDSKKLIRRSFSV